MRKIIVSEFISLDGVIQAPGGAQEDTDGGFAHGGWTWPYWHDEIGARFFAAMQQCDALLLGRKTWQIHGAAFEPMVNDPFGDVMNAIPKYVVSTTLANADAWRAGLMLATPMLRQPPARPRRTSSLLALPRAMPQLWASAAWAFRAGRSSALRLRAPCCATRAS